MRELLIDSCTRILTQYSHSSLVPVESGAMSTALWSALCLGGFPQMLSSAEDGISLSDALAVIACVGSYAAQVPFAETLLARYVLRRSDGSAPNDEPLTLLPILTGGPVRLGNSAGRWHITGSARRMPWARHCRAAVVVAETHEGPLAATVDIDSATILRGVNIAGEPRDDVTFDEAPLTDAHESPLSPSDVRVLGSLIRSAQMCGSISRIVALTLDYAGTRRQFGRTLAEFQAIKHLIARMGQNQAAAGAAFDLAASLAEMEPGSTSLPIAKVRIGEAATAVAAIAHQVFGAIGYTRDHELQAHTRRIWSWRDEFGSEAQWSEQVGRQVCAAGGRSLWPLVAGLQDGLRNEVRSFLRERLSDFAGESNGTRGFNPTFSRELGRRGWIGSQWPRAYGGRESGPLSRFVILEEILAAGAPVQAHMVGERQSGPLLLRYGTDAQRMRYLPRIAAGECYFCIGMSEPEAGSDLAAIRMKAVRADGGYKLNGTKIWTSLAHLCDFVIVLCRTSPMTSERHMGMSQLIVDLHAAGVSISPIANLSGEHEFNQVFFDDVFVPDEGVIGTVGAGWTQALSELTNERGGPDRYLSNFAALQDVVTRLGLEPNERAAVAIGRLVAHLSSLRQLGKCVAERQAQGEDPALLAALVKELGASYEQDAAEVLRQLIPLESPGDNALIEEAVRKAPSYSIRGGSREILLGIIADGLMHGK